MSGPILVVDDDPAIRELLELALRDEGFRVAAARDGLERWSGSARGCRR